MIASVTPTDENESWISSVPPAPTRSTPVADVGPRRRVAMGAVDVEHVDRAVDLVERGIGEHAQVGDPIGSRRRPSRLATKAAWSSVGGVRVAADLLRAAVVAGVGVDGEDLAPPRERRWRARSSSAPGNCRSRRSAHRAGIAVRPRTAPRPDCASSIPRRRRPRSTPRRTCASTHVYTARPNTITQITPRICSTRSLANTSSGAAP